MPPTPASSRSIPASLRPKTALAVVHAHTWIPQRAIGEWPKYCDGCNAIDAGPATPIDVHIAILVPDLRLYALIRDKVAVTFPNYQPVRVFGHVVLEDPNQTIHSMPIQIRQAFCELGLVDPSQVGFAPAEQITLGWPKEATTP